MCFWSSCEGVSRYHGVVCQCAVCLFVCLLVTSFVWYQLFKSHTGPRVHIPPTQSNKLISQLFPRQWLSNDNTKKTLWTLFLLINNCRTPTHSFLKRRRKKWKKSEQSHIFSLFFVWWIRYFCIDGSNYRSVSLGNRYQIGANIKKSLHETVRTKYNQYVYRSPHISPAWRAFQLLSAK